jgi:hypothetical protein
MTNDFLSTHSQTHTHPPIDIHSPSIPIKMNEILTHTHPPSNTHTLPQPSNKVKMTNHPTSHLTESHINSPSSLTMKFCFSYDNYEKETMKMLIITSNGPYINCWGLPKLE